MQYVVFGATGYIGSYIFEHLKRDGKHVIGTARNKVKIDNEKKMVTYDIMRDSLDSLMSKISDSDKVAIVCIAESNIDRCFENYSDAYRINVIQTKKLIHELCMQGFRVIFFSSDQVFDGKRGNYIEEDERNPVNKYGEMKKEMEEYLLQNEAETCILRIPKVVSILRKKQNVLSEWTDKIDTGNICCIKGNRLAFVSIEDIYQACLLVAEKRLSGLYNISGDKVYSRAELARMLYDKLGVKKVEIIECDVEAFHFKEKRPLNLGMCNTKFKIETGYVFESMDSVLDRYIEDLKKIGRRNEMDKEFELWNHYGATQREESVILGPHSSFQWNNSRRHLLFTAARYKFAMKMIGNIYEPNEKKILDLGCSDGFGTYYVAEFADSVLGVDFDEEAISYAMKYNSSGNISYKLGNFLDKKYGDFDGIVSFDVLEHIYPENEEKFINTVLVNLKETGTFVIGSPSLETQQYSKENIVGAHVNVYKGEDFYKMLKQSFHNVYLFTQNDEIIHTGHLRMANYLIAVCSHKKGERDGY